MVFIKCVSGDKDSLFCNGWYYKTIICCRLVTRIIPSKIERFSGIWIDADTIKKCESGVIKAHSLDKMPNCRRSKERGFSLVSQNCTIMRFGNTAWKIDRTKIKILKLTLKIWFVGQLAPNCTPRYVNMWISWKLGPIPISLLPSGVKRSGKNCGRSADWTDCLIVKPW